MVTSPGRTLLDEMVSMVILRTVRGDKGVLPGHERCALALGTGLMRIRRGPEWEEPFIVNGGFATVENNTVAVMSVITERISRMDGLLVELERQRGRRKIETEKWEQELKRTEMAIRRILVDNETSAYTALGGMGEDERS